MNVLQDVEKAVLAVLSAKHSQSLYDLWFKDLHLVQLSDTEAVFSINSDFKRNILQNRQVETVKQALEEVNGFPVEVRFISTQGTGDTPAAGAGGAADDAAASQASDATNADTVARDAAPLLSFSDIEEEEEDKKDELDFGRAIENRSIVSEYTFQNFIVGDSNKFAHAACYAVAQSPTTYNPLFIYGPSGLGKTHLLYAVTNELKRKNPHIRLIYKKCEEFTNELIESVQKGTTVAFREKYRTADVLLIDDIQFIAGKVSVQEEFFNTFNTLYEAEKQIILTSDRPPRDIRPLEDRLCSRFEWGLLADIQPPNLELRCAIIRKKAEQQGVVLSREVIMYLAENLRVNIRQIEGSIKKISAISRLTGTPVSLDMIKRAISDILTGTEPVAVTVDKIFAAVSEKYNVTEEDIKGLKRSKTIMQARHVSVYLIRQITSLPVTAIGDIVNRDHATILSSIDKVTKDMETTPAFADEVNSLIGQIKSSK